MGLYRRHIAPHLINYACGAEPVDKERGGLVPEAEGVVIEVGFGGGAIFPTTIQPGSNALSAQIPLTVFCASVKGPPMTPSFRLR